MCFHIMKVIILVMKNPERNNDMRGKAQATGRAKTAAYKSASYPALSLRQSKGTT